MIPARPTQDGYYKASSSFLSKTNLFALCSVQGKISLTEMEIFPE